MQVVQLDLELFLSKASWKVNSEQLLDADDSVNGIEPEVFLFFFIIIIIH
jgi:hypothetical protein